MFLFNVLCNFGDPTNKYGRVTGFSVPNGFPCTFYLIISRLYKKNISDNVTGLLEHLFKSEFE